MVKRIIWTAADWEVNLRLLAESSAAWEKRIQREWRDRPHPFVPQAGPASLPADRVVLCWWCRCNHAASEVKPCMALPDRKAQPDKVSSLSLSAKAAGPLLPYSEIWAFVTQTTFPDGRRRKTGRLSLTLSAGMLRLSLNDDETGQYATAESDDLDELLLFVEAGMASGELKWRQSTFGQQANKKK